MSLHAINRFNLQKNKNYNIFILKLSALISNFPSNRCGLRICTLKPLAFMFWTVIIPFLMCHRFPKLFVQHLPSQILDSVCYRVCPNPTLLDLDEDKGRIKRNRHYYITFNMTIIIITIILAIISRRWMTVIYIVLSISLPLKESVRAGKEPAFGKTHRVRSKVEK